MVANCLIGAPIWPPNCSNWSLNWSNFSSRCCKRIVNYSSRVASSSSYTPPIVAYRFFLFHYKNSGIWPPTVCHVYGHNTCGKLFATCAWPRVRLVLNLKVTNWPNCRVYTNTRGRLDTSIGIHVSDSQTRVFQYSWPHGHVYSCQIRVLLSDTCIFVHVSILFCFFKKI
jgi:hypothetical protein